MNLRRGLDRIFALLSVVWIIGVFAYPFYEAHRSEQIYTKAFDECMKTHDDRSDIKWCEDKLGIEMNGIPTFFALNYHGEGLAVNIGLALLAPLLVYGGVRLAFAVALWIRRGFLIST